MVNILKYFKNYWDSSMVAKVFCIALFYILISILLFFLDEALSIGLLMVIFLTAAVFFIFIKLGLKDKNIYLIFFLGLLVHVAAVLFIRYTGFRPFGGGADFEGYNQTAIELSHRFTHGNFSLSGLYAEHYFPILIGVLYIFTLPQMLVGQLFVACLAAISIALIYMLAIEIGGSKRTAVAISFVATLYPSYIYFGSLLLKDTVIVPSVLLGFLIAIKMLNKFSWIKFFAFFIILTALVNVRFYIGYSMMFVFILSWFLLSNLMVKKRIIFGIVMFIVLGFAPLIAGNGYYGSNSFTTFLTPQKITLYREIAYNPTVTEAAVGKKVGSSDFSTDTSISGIIPGTATANKAKNVYVEGNGSSFVVGTGLSQGPVRFLLNSFESFIFVMFGPFPWQIRYVRQLFSLLETIPWYLAIIYSISSIYTIIKKRGFSEFKTYRLCLPLLLFGILSMAAVSLFINNYGIIARIRIPVMICFFIVMFVGLNEQISNIISRFSKKFSKI